jgi:glucose/arabinose dehydrogenase
MKSRIARLAARAAVVPLVLSCGPLNSQPPAERDDAARTGTHPVCDEDNGGLTLAAGFCALVAHDGVGAARHIAVAPNGDVYVALTGRQNTPAGIMALRDTNDDGRLDRQEHIEAPGGTGIAVHDGWLYYAPNTMVLRYRLDGTSLAPVDPPDTLVSGFPLQRSHAAKTLAFDGRGGIFVNVGGPSNACQRDDREPGSPGQDPCPELELQTGIWRFDLGRTNQRQVDGERYATGIRNAVALAWHPADDELYVVQHGRDMLNVIDPENFTAEDNAELPAEEFLRVTRGSDWGHPYCYFDHHQGRRVLAPEYDGDGREVGRCDQHPEPMYAFPAHWAPNELLFYTADAFGEAYRNGAFIAWHGSWNRAPLPQRGYKVTFQRVENGVAIGEPEIFADGFASVDPIARPQDARFRPMGLAIAPDGSLYIGDSVNGRIWRVLRRE